MNGRVRRGPTDERGSTLLLFPAAVLVLLLLGAIAVDLSALHMASRELHRATGQAADDAAAMVDEATLRRSGETRIDHAGAERVVRFELAASHLPGPLIGNPIVRINDTTGTVAVTATIDVAPVFGRVVGRGNQQVTVSASSRLIDDD